MGIRFCRRPKKAARWGFLAASLCLQSAAAGAQGPGAEAKPWAGVWTGSLGGRAIIVCFNASEHSNETGSYYDHRQLSPIGLKAVATSDRGLAIWKEEDASVWRLEVGQRSIRGERIAADGKSTVPIQLAPVKQSGEPTNGNACGADAYNLALETAPQVVAGPAQAIRGIRYRKLTVNIGRKEHEGTADRGLYRTTVEILGSGRPLAALNQGLRALISTDDLFQCRRANLGSTGDDGTATQEVSAVSVDGPWLTVNLWRQSDCGLAHPSVWGTAHTWNLLSGEQENLAAWFRGNESAKLTPEMGSHGTLPSPLAQFVAGRIGKDEPGAHHLDLGTFVRCYGDIDPETISYSLELFSGGINFVVPTTASGACGDSFKVGFKALRPFLNAKGRAAVAGLGRRWGPNH